MKALFCVPLVLAAGLWADEAQDRAAIDKVIAAINDPAERARQFTSDVDSGVDFTRLLELHKSRTSNLGLVTGANETWRELTEPRVVGGSIRFITRDVATVDGASTIEGAMTLTARVPLFFILKREGTVWRVSSVRLLNAPTALRMRLL